MPRQRKTEAAWVESQGRWQIKVQVNGRRKTFYSSAPGRKGKIEAERKADEWLDNGASEDPRFEAVWAAFLDEMRPKRDGASTVGYKKYESIGRLHLLPSLRLKRISSIKIQDWQDCINAAYKRGLSKKSCVNIRGSITALYNYARKNRYGMERPEFLTIPNDAPVGERKILQPDKLQTLFKVDWIEHYGKKQPCFFIHAWRLMVLTGLRRGELCGLRCEDLREGVLHIRRSINSSQEETIGKTKNARRYIALSDRMLSVLADQRALLKERNVISPWLFPDEQGSRLDSNHLYKIWYTYSRQHGMGCSLHELRHTMVSIVKVDVPEALLKPIIGHSKAMDTQGVYGHAVDGEAVRASQMIDDVFNRILD